MAACPPVPGQCSQLRALQRRLIPSLGSHSPQRVLVTCCLVPPAPRVQPATLLSLAHQHPCC